MKAKELLSKICRVANPEDEVRFVYGSSEVTPASFDVNSAAHELIISLDEVCDLSDPEKHEG